MSRRLSIALLLATAIAVAVAGAENGIIRLREPRATEYTVPVDEARRRTTPWLQLVRRSDGARVEFGSRLVVRSEDPGGIARIRARFAGAPMEAFDASTVVVDLGDARRTLDTAAALAGDPEIAWAVPVRRHRAVLHDAWGPPPADPYFDRQYPLDATGTDPGFARAAGDLNARGAWPLTRGAGVTIGFFDDGMDTAHPDLAPSLDPDLHHNFFTGAASGRHSLSTQYHGTAVAGLAVAAAGNGIGISGVAPEARGTAWVIFDRSGNLPDTARLADAFQRETNRVAVQNHSWGNADFAFLEPTAIERLALSNALTAGRDGLGVVMVRSAGNTRIRNYFGSDGIGDINADGFGNEPGAIAVAAVRRDGRVAGYSTPGAAILVAAPGGETAEGSQLFSLDPVGDAGRSSISGSGPVLADYLFGTRSTPGTSFAAPHISGLVALMLSAHPGLHHRDVQILLALSARPTDRNEAQRRTNAAGLSWSPDTGFGMPDAGEAVRRAIAFRTQRPRVRVSAVTTTAKAVPDDGLAVVVTADGLAPLRIAAAPGTGRHPDSPASPGMPLVDVGAATAPIPQDLTGRAALIRRGAGDIVTAINHAAAAGALLAIVTHNGAGNARVLLSGTDAVRIPAVLVGNQDGETLRGLLGAHPDLRVATELDAARFDFTVEDGLVLDSVQVRIAASHPRAGDLRITVRTPSGTVSVLQRATYRSGAQAEEWWYSSKEPLLEAGRGAWTVAVSDESPGSTGTVDAVDLILSGTRIVDTDGDGLDDDWERRHWDGLQAVAWEDSDGDGWSHAAEQFLSTDPRSDDRPLIATMGPAGDGRLRLAWPVVGPGTYAVEAASDPAGPFDAVGSAPQEVPEGAWFLSPGLTRRFLRVVRTDPQ